MSTKFFVSIHTSLFAQHPVVRTTEKVVAKRFKGEMFDEAQERAEKLAKLLNDRESRVRK